MGEATFIKYKKLANLFNDSNGNKILYEIKDPSLNGLIKPQKGDLYIDFEGYPFFQIGRNFEYLYGICQEPLKIKACKNRRMIGRFLPPPRITQHPAGMRRGSNI